VAACKVPGYLPYISGLCFRAMKGDIPWYTHKFEMAIPNMFTSKNPPRIGDTCGFHQTLPRNPRKTMALEKIEVLWHVLTAKNGWNKWWFIWFIEIIMALNHGIECWVAQHSIWIQKFKDLAMYIALHKALFSRTTQWFNIYKMNHPTSDWEFTNQTGFNDDTAKFISFFWCDNKASF
jgi:hypothetical protein